MPHFDHNAKQQIEIQSSKAKIYKGLLGSLAFVAIDCWFITCFPAPLALLGGVSILLFGGFLLLFVKQLIENKPGLLIDNESITDNSRAGSAGRILWSDVTTIYEIETKHGKAILLYVKNPEHYIDRQTGFFRRWILRANFTEYKTPIVVSALTLKIPFEALLSLIVEKHGKLRHPLGPNGQEHSRLPR